MRENVAALYTDRRFLELIEKQEPEHLRADLKQFVILAVSQWADKKNYLGDCFPVACGIVRNQLHSDKSKFFREYRKAQTAGRTIETMPSSRLDQMEAIVQTILAGKPVYDTFHHRAVTLPMKSIRYQADYWAARQNSLFPRSCVVACVPLVLFMDASDSDQVEDRLTEVRQHTDKLLGAMCSENVCVVEVGDIQILDSKIV